MTEKESIRQLLNIILHDLKINHGGSQTENLSRYVELLIDELKRQRLTGEKTAEGIVNKLIYDSLFPLKLIDMNGRQRMLDLGTGGGIPGIPLKIFLPETEMYLLDGSQKKIAFLDKIVKDLGLNDTHPLLCRAEVAGHDLKHRGQYDFVFSKAVAEMNVLAELMLPFLRIGGKAILYKGPKGQEEAGSAEEAIIVCGGKVDRVLQYRLPTGEKRYLYLLHKVLETPLQYPRKAGKPSKRPIGS